MTPRERGRELRRAINESIREGRVYYDDMGGGVCIADVSYQFYVDEETPSESIRSKIAVSFEVEFCPNQIEHNHWRQQVRNCGAIWSVDWKTYRWAIRTLSEYQVLQKLEDE